jgi:uncharacterized membrane protein
MKTGLLRVLCPTPNWEDFVQLSFGEIRLYVAQSFQVARRPRAMIDNLVKALPESRRPALLRERDLLDQAIETLKSPREQSARAHLRHDIMIT